MVSILVLYLLDSKTLSYAIKGGGLTANAMHVPAAKRTSLTAVATTLRGNLVPVSKKGNTLHNISCSRQQHMHQVYTELLQHPAI